MMIDGMNQFPAQTYFYQTDIIGGQKISADRRSGVYLGGLQQHVAQSGGGHGKIPWKNSKKKAPRKREMLGHIYLIGDIYLTHPYILAIYIAIYIGMGQISVYIGVFVKKSGMGQIYGLESDTFHVIH